MATEALKSTAITAFENIRTGAGTTPASKVIHGGILKQAVGKCEMTVQTTIGSTYRFCRLPATARIAAINVKCDAAIVAAIVDIGVYATPENGGAAIDANCYATTFDIEAAAIGTTELNLRNQALGIELVEQAIWQDASVSALPAGGTEYDIVATTTTAATTGGTLVMIVDYVDGQ